MNNHSNSVPASYGSALLTQPIYSGGAHDEQRKVFEMSRHLQELTSENTRLRNSIIDVNDEVFSLRACMASVELEAKYNAEQELLHMQSELTFKNKELSSLNKDYQKLLKELSALKQTKAGAAQTIDTGHQLPADSAEQHCRDADAYAAPDRTVALEPLDSIDVGATISGQGDHDNCNSLPEAPAAPRDDDDDAAVGDTSVGSPPPPLSAPHMAGNSCSRSSAPEGLAPPVSLASVSSRISYISFLFQTYSTAVQQNSSPRLRSPSDLQRETTRCCVLLKDVAREVKALSDQALDPRTCSSSSSHRCSIDWSPLCCKALRLCQHVSLLYPRRVEPAGLQLLDAVFSAGPLQQRHAPWAGERTAGVVNQSHRRVVAALQIPLLLLRDPIDASSACQLISSKESSSPITTAVDSSSRRDYLLYLEGVLHRLCSREERRSMMSEEKSDDDVVLSRRAMELTVSSIVNFFSARIHSDGIDGSINSSISISCEEEGLLEMLFDSRAVYDRLGACPASSRGAVLFTAFAQQEEHSLSAGLKTRLLRLCGCALTNQRLFRLFASNQRYSKQASVTVKEEDVPDQRSSSSVETASLLSRRCQSTSPSFLFDAVHSLLLASKDNDFSASVEQLHFKVQTVEFLLRLLFSRGSEFVQLMLGTQLSSSPDNNKVDNEMDSSRRVVDVGSSLRKRRADAHLQREAKTQSPIATTLALESATIPLASEQQAPSSSSRGTSAVMQPVGAISCPVRVVDIEIEHSSTIDCRLVCMLADYWMRLIRSLDVCSALLHGTAAQTMRVQLISRLHCLLTGLLDHLSAADCDFLLSDVADLFHEYIYRWNTSSWHGDLRRMMADSMFKFLEVNRPLQE